MHMQKLFKDSKTYLDGTSEDLFSRGLCLASSTTMIKEDVLNISNKIKEIL
jgi:UDP-N-acetylbacillosamine transaminase